ncbi:MAG: TIGR01212 family radical SAM protein [Desulforegulaceae bacterium]|nr:TIGR01212 family radical SAM protein [Desulforegulaceae bacterium]
MDTKIKRYKDLNSFLREYFNERVQKVSVDAGFTCPNRDGSISYGGCTFCNPKGSGTGAFARGISIKSQLESGKKRLGKRYKAKKFLAYFQAFTNTYGTKEELKKIYDEALSVEGVCGLSIGTRPDCIDKEKIRIFEEYAQKGYLIWMEYGLQSIHDQTLKRINRGHDFNSFEKAVELTKNRGIYICAHVILGLPGETREDMIETAKKISEMKVDGVKLHLLYVVKGTSMETEFENKTLRCLTQKKYVEVAADFIEHISKNITIHRVTGDPHIDELVAPFWSLRKDETLTMINKELEKRGSFQGSKSEFD